MVSVSILQEELRSHPWPHRSSEAFTSNLCLEQLPHRTPLIGTSLRRCWEGPAADLCTLSPLRLSISHLTTSPPPTHTHTHPFPEALRTGKILQSSLPALWHGNSNKPGWAQGSPGLLLFPLVPFCLITWEACFRCVVRCYCCGEVGTETWLLLLRLI